MIFHFIFDIISKEDRKQRNMENGYTFIKEEHTMSMKVINNPEMESSPMNKKKARTIRRINVSDKRQITIPKRFYDMLNMGQEITCELRDNEIVLRPVLQSDDFSEEILKDLVARGLSGQELIQEFQKVKSQIRPAVEKMLEESSLAAENMTDNGDEETEELLGI